MKPSIAFVMRSLSAVWCLTQATVVTSTSFAQQPALASAEAPPLTIDEIRVQLFFEDSGKLGDDLVRTKPTLWNTIIGEGDAGGAASSFLISVAISGKLKSGDQVVVMVTNDVTKKAIAIRRFSKLALSTDRGGQVIKPILIENQVCNPIRITARTKASQKTVLIPFECGE